MGEPIDLGGDPRVCEVNERRGTGTSVVVTPGLFAPTSTVSSRQAGTTFALAVVAVHRAGQESVVAVSVRASRLHRGIVTRGADVLGSTRVTQRDADRNSLEGTLGGERQRRVIGATL